MKHFHISTFWSKGKKNSGCDRKYRNRNPRHLFIHEIEFSRLKERDVQILCPCLYISGLKLVFNLFDWVACHLIYFLLKFTVSCKPHHQ